MRAFTATAAIMLAGGLLVGCSDSSEVPSGTYEGTIVKVVPDAKEIYVETNDGKELELYFTDETELTSGMGGAEFSLLKEGMTVEVEVENVDGHLKPVSVKITP